MRKTSKLFTALIFFMLMVSSAFAKNGIMAGEGHVQMIQTEWFDIIYGKESEESAFVLSSSADEIYLELADMYGWNEPPCRMPVVLTTQVEVFNAYFSTGNYSHIVLFVTNPIEELANQPDNLLWTFRHELTHAYNYNMKSNVTTAWTTVFGDASTFHTFCVTPGVAEGATLTSESIKGNGRLNDEFSKHIVKQAKLEGKFPKYSDVQGSRDRYPSGSFYNFNGAFHEYLQREYGLEKYAKFWYNCINNSVTTSQAFRKAYKLKLRKEWAKFAEQYAIPEIPANPLEVSDVKDLFYSPSKNYSLDNIKGAVYTGLSQSEKGITYVDDRNSKVFFISKEDLAKNKITPETLFQYSAIKSATQSTDGKFVTISYYDANENNYRYHLAIYNTETKKWYKPNYHGVKEGIVVKQGSDYYLVALKFTGEKSAVKITKLVFDEKDRITGEEDEITFDFNRIQTASNFTPVKEGTFAYIMNKGLNFSVQIMNLEGKLLAEYKVPASENKKHFIMHYLSVDNTNSDELYFSWVSEGTMPRVGKLNLADGAFSFNSQDLSGGIFYPVKYNDELIYVGKFYEYNRLFRKSVNFTEQEKIPAEIINYSENSSTLSEKIDENLISSINYNGEIKPYNPFNYLRGTFIPLSNLQSSSYDLAHRGSYRIPWGITYITNNPWDSLTYTFSAGWGSQTNSTGISFNVSGTDNTGTNTWSTNLFSEFDYKGWKAANIRLTSSYNNAISVKPSLFIHAGRSNASKEDLKSYSDFSYLDYVNIPKVIDTLGVYGNHDDNYYLYSSGSILITLKTIRSVYDNRFSYKGLYAGLLPAFYFSFDLTNAVTDYSYNDVTLFAEYYIPRLVPFDCVNGETYNFPVKLFASAFSTSSIYSSLIDIPVATVDIPAPDLAMIAGEVLLYGKELQTSVKFLPFLYYHDIYVSLIGSIGFNYTSGKRDNFGITHVSDFASEIANGENKPMAVLAIKCAAGMNLLNFGAMARSASKNYISITPTFIFPSLGEKPIYRTMFGLNLQI